MLDEQIGLPSAAREGLKVTHGIAEDRQFWSTFSVHEARPATASQPYLLLVDLSYFCSRSFVG